MSAQAKKKKKPKKKKAVVAVPGVAVCPAPTGAPEQAAPELPSRVGRQRTCDETMCINCGCTGHFRSECEAVRPHLATVTLAPEQVLPPGVVISADLIQAELAAYIGDFRDSEFAWEVTERAPLVFSVPFPSAELLRVCSHDLNRCPINKFLISVHAAAADSDLMPPVEKVWVLVYRLPRGGRSVPRGGKLAHILKAISEPVGKLVTANLASFEDDGPARIEILCPAPAEIAGMSLIFYFGTKGRCLTFELEFPAPEDLLGPAPAATVPGVDGQDGDGGSSEESFSCEEDDADVGVPPAASDGRCTPISSAADPSGPARAASRVASRVEPMVMVGPSPVATPVAGLEIVEGDEVSVGMEVCPSSQLPGGHYSRSRVPLPDLGIPD
ncbi:hypothetical protein ZWY2020_027166 [Hordeum vulgare]|nr:hypothetical protein ZWY2020_027166 [Hordeum vulgare]